MVTIKSTSRRALHSVKRGLGFLVGLEVPPLTSDGLIVDTQADVGESGDTTSA